MKTKNEFVTSLQAKLDEWNAEVDKMEAEARKAKAEAVQGYTEQMSQLKGQARQVAEKLKEIQSATDDTWQRLQKEAESRWSELSSSLQKAKEKYLPELAGK